MRRRDFIAALGGAAVVLPKRSSAQQQPPIRRLGILTTASEDDPIFRDIAFPALRAGLKDLGWIEGVNYRWDFHGLPNATTESLRMAAAALVASGPDLIIGFTPGPVKALHDATSSIPILFAIVDDPVARGLVTSFTRPGGNVTGIVIVDPPVGGKWVQLLHQIAPQVTRIAVAYDPNDSGMIGIYREPIKQAADQMSLGISFEPIAEESQIDRVIDGLGQRPNTGLISGLDAFTAVHRVQIIAAAARNHLPAIYAVRYWPTAGGLMSYGMDQSDMYRQLDLYVDRILRGAHPADLPVMAPRKWELVINLKTAKALGIEVPPLLLASADQVIE